MAVSIVRQSKYRHVFCKPVKHDSCMSDVRITEITWDSLFCAVNPKFIAIITKGAGGPFMVIPVNKVGRIDKDYPFVDAHKAPCLEVQWSPFNDNLIASCSEDSTAKVWLIPDRGLSRTLNTAVIELEGHQKRVNTLAWHPTAQNILATAGGENKIFFWNIESGDALLEIEGHTDQIFGISFNYDGSQFVTTCKDRKLRIIDSHSGEVVTEGVGHEGVKPQRAIFLKDGRIFTTGFTKRSERLYALRSPENLSVPIVQEELDTSNGVLFPLYDEDSGLLYLAGKGDCTIRYYEINNDPPFVHYINTYTTSEPQRAIGFQSKRGIVSEENEVDRIFKVTTKGVVDVLRFFVPRKSDLFQADLYPDTRSLVPAMTADQFIEGQNAPPVLVPVNPEASQVKSKIKAVKKTNILAQQALAQQQQQQQQILQRQQQPSSPPQNTGYSSQSSQHSYSPPASSPPHSHSRQPVVDTDMGIVTFDRVSSADSGLQPPSEGYESSHPSPVSQASSVRLRPREDNAGAPRTAGQQRAAAELERIRRDQSRTASAAAEEDLPPSRASTRYSTATAPSSNSPSRASSVVGGSEPTCMEELLADLQKMKQVLRQHERRIRMLEDQVADVTMANTYGL